MDTIASIVAYRARSEFRGAVEGYAAADLARYHAASLIERWMVSDMGRSSLSGAVFVMDALGSLTVAALMSSAPVARGEVSRGRARLYLQRAIANGLIAADPPGAPMRGDRRLRPTSRFRAVMTGTLGYLLRSASVLAPEIRPALARLDDDAFVRRVTEGVGRILAADFEPFPPDRPAALFYGRDGGARMLADLLSRQRPGREHLLEACELSRSALARASHCSRAHVIRLLNDGETRGLLSLEGRTLTLSAELSEDVEAYVAGVFAVGIAATKRALAETPRTD